jgi:glutamine cyclotransferase
MRRFVPLLGAVAVALLLLAACSARKPTCPQSAAPPVYGYRVNHVYPHDPNAYTQGLLYEGGYLYEGTGLQGRSSLRKVEIATGAVLERHQLSSLYFGEGIALAHDRIVQLTWRNHLAFRYELDGFAVTDTLVYPTEGWGITFDGASFVMSDGSDTLVFRDTTDFAEIRRVGVQDRGRRIHYLNELEYVRGKIYANVWGSDTIVVISPATGKVAARIDLTGIISPADRGSSPDNVLNGIAYDAIGGRLFVTGKRWAKLFEIDVDTR